MKQVKWNFLRAPGVLPACAALLLCGSLLSGCSRNVASAPGVPVASAPTGENNSTATEAQNPAAPKATTINWQPSLEAALAEAKKSQKPIMIDFYTTWCPPCKVLDKEIYPDPAVTQEAQNFVSLKLDAELHRELAQEYKITGYPTLVFLDASGGEYHREDKGVPLDSADFVKLLEQARSYVAPTPA